jgi:hypothetical protein
MAHAKASEQRRIRAMSPTERVILALSLGRRMDLLQGLRREQR